MTRALSPRQTEVALLVADGLTDKQIAQQLGVNARTVRKYVERIAARLTLDRGRNIRTQITALVVRAAA